MQFSGNRVEYQASQRCTVDSLYNLSPMASGGWSTSELGETQEGYPINEPQCFVTTTVMLKLSQTGSSA
jgi:hypothetical protein